MTEGTGGLKIEGLGKEVPKNLVELQEIAKSEARLNVENIQTTVPWNDYLLVTKKDGSATEIFDHSMEKIEKILTSTKFQISIDPTLLRDVQDSNENLGYISGNGGGANTFTINSKDTPDVVKPFFINIMKKQKATPDQFLPVGNIENQKVNFDPRSEMKIINNGDYILFYDKDTDYFCAYSTINNQGITQSPENWQLYTLQNSKSINPVLKDAISAFSEMPKEGFSELQGNDKYSAIITGATVNILDSKDLSGAPLYSDTIPEVGQNIDVDPANENIIYYCSENNPKNLVRLDLSKGATQPDKTVAKLPKDYKEMKNLQLDPTGSLFLFYSEDDLVLLAKDTLEEVSRKHGVKGVDFDSSGNITAIDDEGHLVKYKLDMDTLQKTIAAGRAKKLAEGVDLDKIFSESKSGAEKYDDTDNEYFQEVKDQWEAELRTYLEGVVDIGTASDLRARMENLKIELRKQNLKEGQIRFILKDIDAKLQDKEKVFVKDEVDRVVDTVADLLKKDLSIKLMNTVREELDTLKPYESIMDQAATTAYNKALKEADIKANELYTKEGDRITKEIGGIVDGVKNELEGFESKRDFDSWEEFRLPQYKNKLQTMLRDVPVEAKAAYEEINEARIKIEQLAKDYHAKFKVEYAKIRESAAEKNEILADNLEEDIKSLNDRLVQKGFEKRQDAEQYINSSESKKFIEEEIEALEKDNPERAKELRKKLKVTMAQSMYDIESGKKQKVIETGQQVVTFGDEDFPVYEAKTQKKEERKVEMTFEADKATAGPAVGPADMFGDVMLVVTNPDGSKTKSRVYENKEDEDEWRLGLRQLRQQQINPSYIPAKDFASVRSDYNLWKSGELKKEYESFREDLSEIYDKRKPAQERGKEDVKWKEEYKAKLEEYKKFLAEHNISLLRHIDTVADKEVADENGKGFVPSWRSNWVVDKVTEDNLEKMAELFKMQLTLGEGVLNLNGHTGTGKDVLLKMFANRTKRPYFATDCTKWTTEFELSEDVMLESKDGATQTVKVPSAVLRGIQTPGSIVYFNEVNGMPEQSQIFLHALWDEKRALTLKTSSGKNIEAHPSVLIASSMNPNYPGTFDPQYATKSRMVSMEVDYPELEVEADENDSNKRPKYNSAEAMRIARATESLEDLTLDPDLDRNEFIQVWDKYVNGIDNGAPQLTEVQRFDLNCIKALVQFGNNLRGEFIKNFEKTRESRNSLPVQQPITAREFQRCAWALSQIPEEEKATKDYDMVAKELLEKFFLSHVYSKKDRDEIKNAMLQWVSKNRIAS